MSDTIQLKGGFSTENLKLDRIEQFDEKSRNYSIGEIREASKSLRSYTWRCNDWFDQGTEGACVGFSLGHELAARPSEVKGLDYDFLLKKLYWEAKKNDPWDGGSYPGANPQYGGTSVLAGVKEIQKLGYIKEYRWAFNTDDLLYGLGRNGPAVLGIPWFDGMYSPDSKGFIRPEGNVVGGHAILARAINVKKGYVTLRNSWGKGWGKSGDCYVTFEDLDTLLQSRGEACFMMRRSTKPKK